MNRVNWTQVGIFAIVVLLVFLIGISLLGSFRFYGYGMAGSRHGMMGPGMMGSNGWGFPLFGWLGMLLMWIVPLGFLGLLVAGIFWLVRAAGGASGAGLQTPSVVGTCSDCGRPTQVDWQNCPYCGGSLA
jgi:hypothetical protein